MEAAIDASKALASTQQRTVYALLRTQVRGQFLSGVEDTCVRRVYDDWGEVGTSKQPL